MSDLEELELLAPRGKHIDTGNKKEFAPWHKPRKQWVRNSQWKSEIRLLIARLGTELKDRPLRYFSLPGLDLLDVRVVHEVCQSMGVRLRFIGFCEDRDAETESNVSLHEVRRLPNVDWEHSHYVNERFETVCDKDSVAYQRLTEFGTIDVVNLDLCDSFASRKHRGPKAGESISTYFAALKQLVERQVSGRVHPWLFFLTSRCNTNVDDDQVLDSWRSRITSNRDRSELFDRLASEFEQGGLWQTDEFVLGLSKWLAGWLLSGRPQWLTTLKPMAHYRVKDPGDMVSLSYWFRTYHAMPVDVTGLTGRHLEGFVHPSLEELELDCALDFIPSLCEAIDVDELVASDPLLRAKLARETVDLLRTARYPISDYYTHFGIPEPDSPIAAATPETLRDRSQSGEAAIAPLPLEPPAGR